MEKKQYNVKGIKIHNIEKREGVFNAEGQQPIPYSNYYINFTIKDNPLVFKAKIDKQLREYLQDMLSDDDLVADSDTKSSFWGD